MFLLLRDSLLGHLLVQRQFRHLVVDRGLLDRYPVSGRFITDETYAGTRGALRLSGDFLIAARERSATCRASVASAWRRASR
ncbi:MAG: hypothetical protein LBB76_12680 [Azoarcus sp.]|jgi:hypothetical protein|nr:hypothetical protein [Azoarcus sp.]